MAEPATKKRLRPSLLDRLTDLHPERKQETMDEVAATEAQLREQVRRDLSWLFNATELAANLDLSRYPEVARSILNYGIVDLTGQLLSSVKPEDLEKRVRTALLNYEPRLLPESLRIAISLGKKAYGAEGLVVEIHADLHSEPLPIALYVRTAIDVETGRVTIGDASERA